MFRGYNAANLTNNTTDYYKLQVTKAGTFTLTATTMTDATVGMYLYEVAGNDIRGLNFVTHSKTANVNTVVPPGIYYVRLEKATGYGDYKPKAT